MWTEVCFGDEIIVIKQVNIKCNIALSLKSF